MGLDGSHGGQVGPTRKTAWWFHERHPHLSMGDFYFIFYKISSFSHFLFLGLYNHLGSDGLKSGSRVPSIVYSSNNPIITHA